jgi:2-polyprenyl-3-methyl-5-hydroxy-6-metoxy-1,4-benzoquinol methylase
MDKHYKYLEWNEDNIRNFWDYESRFVERYFAYRVGDILVKILSKYFGNAKTVLDYGSGRGHLVKPLVDQGLRVSTMDFSDRAVAGINKKYQNCPGFERTYSYRDIESLEKKFDLIFLVEIFEHLDDFELEKAVKNIRKFLAAEGTAFITTPNDEKLGESMVCCPECRKIFHRWQHVRNWNTQTLKEYMEKKGFTVPDIFAIDLNYEKQKQNFTLRQKFISRLSERDRRWEYKLHLICVVKSQ